MPPTLQGPCSTTFGFSPTSPYLQSMTDALMETTSYDRDPVGRILKETFPFTLKRTV